MIYKGALRIALVVCAIHTVGSISGGLNMISLVELTQKLAVVKFKLAILLFGKLIYYDIISI